MARIVDLGVVQYYWIAGADGIANELAPVVTEIAAGKNISEYVVTTTSIDAAASDTVNERSVTDVSNAVVPTVGNVEGTLVLFRDFDPATFVPTVDDPMTLIGNGRNVGWIARRVGKPASAAPAADDLYDLFLVMTDNPQTSGGTGEGYLKVTYPLLQQGRFAKNVEVVAGA